MAIRRTLTRDHTSECSAFGRCPEVLAVKRVSRAIPGSNLPLKTLAYTFPRTLDVGKPGRSALNSGIKRREGASFDIPDDERPHCAHDFIPRSDKVLQALSSGITEATNGYHDGQLLALPRL